MKTHRTTAGLARGLSLVEVVVASLALLAMSAAVLPMLGSGLRRSGVMISANNLRTLAQGYAAYEASWGGRQFSYLREQMGNYASCSAYASAACPPQVILGSDDFGGLWGYWIGGSTQGCTAAPGNCGNWVMLVPIPLGGRFPAVAAGPDRLHHQGRAAAAAEHQGAAFMGPGGQHGALQNDQAMPTEEHALWR